MEFKANFLGLLFVDFIYYGSYFLFFSIIFNYVDSLLEFTRADVMTFLVITYLMDTFYMFAFAGNLGKLNRMIVKGDLDFVLLKPVNSQFFISFRYFNSYAIVSVLILVGLLCVTAINTGREIGLFHMISFVFSFGLGLAIFFSIDFIIASLAFWFKNFNVGGWLSHEILKFSYRPDTIYAGLLRKTMFSLIPMALVSSVPARMLLYGHHPKYLTLQVLVAVVFLIIARIVWVRGLRLYESASS
ncbi:MAG: ABC transporter permease [Fidelibacterota bacterium]